MPDPAVPTPADTHACPFCLETIKAGALRCKHCHADLTDTASAPAVPLVPASLSPPPATLESWQVLDLLAALIDKNLVAYDEDARGQGRYRLPETIHQYARDRLQESGESETARGRHRDWFAEYAARPEPRLQEPEYPNLRAALQWSLANQDAASLEAARRLLRPLATFWWLRGNVSEGREVYARVLSWVRQFASASPALAQLGHESLNVAGHLANRQEDYQAARALFEEALRLSRERNNSGAVADSLNNLAYVAMYEGDLDAARAHNEESLRVFEADGNPIGMGSALYALGLVAHTAGQFDQARSRYEEALAVWGERPEVRNSVRYVLLNLGHVARSAGDFARARSRYDDCLRWFVSADDRRGIAQALEACASLAVVSGEQASAPAATRAGRLFGAADRLRDDLGTPMPAVAHLLHDPPMNAARAALGEEAFADAWAAGRAFTLEQAVADALSTDA